MKKLYQAKQDEFSKLEAKYVRHPPSRNRYLRT